MGFMGFIGSVKFTIGTCVLWITDRFPDHLSFLSVCSFPTIFLKIFIGLLKKSF